MASGVVLTFTRGDTWQFTVQVFQQPPSASSPANITGWFSWFTAKFNTTDTDSQAAVQVTSGNGAIQYTIPTAGIALVTVPAALTAGFADGDVNLSYDVQFQDLSGNIFTVQSGTIAVTPDDTRATASPAGVVPLPFAALAEQFLSVANAATLSALPAAALPDGTIAYVQGGAAGVATRYYQLLSTSAAVVDNVTVLSATPGGRWLRLALVPG